MGIVSGRFDERVVFVTGSASGIGLGIARRFFAEGARLVLLDINTSSLKPLAEEFGERCLTIGGDVSKEADMARAVKAGADRFGGFDVAINNAGVGSYAHITELTQEKWDQTIDISLKGVFFGMKHAARQMLASKTKGVIINIASLNSRQPAEGMAAYCAAKAGVEMMTKVGAMELGPHRIRVCAISPGAVVTPAIKGLTSAPPGFAEEARSNRPLGGISRPEDIAAAASFLASDDARTITGETLFVDGGSQTKRYPLLSDYIPDYQALVTRAERN